jgi:hypothetical protein
MPKMSDSRPLTNMTMFLDHLLGEPNDRELISPSCLRWGPCIVSHETSGPPGSLISDAPLGSVEKAK